MTTHRIGSEVRAIINSTTGSALFSIEKATTRELRSIIFESVDNIVWRVFTDQVMRLQYTVIKRMNG
jgi:hypothetical protein